MTRMVQVALAEDVTEAEEIQTILHSAGIETDAGDRRRAPSPRDRGRAPEGPRPGIVPRGRAARHRGDDGPRRARV